MKQYTVKITEILEKEVLVSADSILEAEEIVIEQWNSGIYILDADNFVDVKVEATESEE